MWLVQHRMQHTLHNKASSNLIIPFWHLSQQISTQKGKSTLYTKLPHSTFTSAVLFIRQAIHYVVAKMLNFIDTHFNCKPTRKNLKMKISNNKYKINIVKNTCTIIDVYFSLDRNPKEANKVKNEAFQPIGLNRIQKTSSILNFSYSVFCSQ